MQHNWERWSTSYCFFYGELSGTIYTIFHALTVDTHIFRIFSTFNFFSEVADLSCHRIVSYHSGYAYSFSFFSDDVDLQHPVTNTRIQLLEAEHCTFWWKRFDLYVEVSEFDVIAGPVLIIWGSVRVVLFALVKHGISYDDSSRYQQLLCCRGASIFRSSVVTLLRFELWEHITFYV